MMKYVTYTAFLISVLFAAGCQKGDSHYLDYNTSAIKYEGTVYDFLIHQPGVYDSLALVLERLPQLKAKLNNPQSHVTFFAANNRAFALALTNLNIARKNNGLKSLYLEDIDLGLLDELMYRYVFDEEKSVEDFKPYLDGVSVFSSKYGYEMHVLYQVLTSSGLVGGGQQQLMFSDVNGSIYQRYWDSTTTSSVDMYTTNGILHTLTPRHEFGFGKLTIYLSWYGL
ncbi:hypothetical protein G5B30_06710 [Sphingobacterium sp. SGG-5]|uniref:hypothetical protein n=1 Tax=Sphingobacterium sp. SGG-5 TaxID=2710881 RepID=UPI0013ED32A0|nr:hypothetical protein [Sphingobacterium sp. SGG-5]NGM61606.1 hypothetical protein [Sphingobacterium sp. SGG-5]